MWLGHVPKGCHTYSVVCFPQTGSHWGLVMLLPCPRSSQRPSLMALSLKDRRKPCAYRPSQGLLSLDGSPVSHTLWEKPESGFPLVWHSPYPHHSRGLTAHR